MLFLGRQGFGHLVTTSIALRVLMCYFLDPAHFVECTMVHSPRGFESPILIKKVSVHSESEQTPLGRQGFEP